MSGESRIDPRAFGHLQATSEAQRREIDTLSANIAALTASIDAFKAKVTEEMEGVKSQLAEARGGWRMMLLFGGAATTIGAVVAKAAAWLAKSAGGPAP